jgi:transposase
MSKVRRQYSQEFKHEAVRLMTEGGVPLAQVSRDLGACTSVLGKWKRAVLSCNNLNSASPAGTATDPKVKAFPGHGVARDEEMTHLRRELEIAQQERDILKKAVGIF